MVVTTPVSPLDPVNQNIQEVTLANAGSFATYRVSFTHVKGNATTSLMQIGEVELLGVADTSGKPAIQTQPVSVKAYQDSSAFFFVTASGNPYPSFQWLKGTNGAYVPLNDNGKVSGAQSGSISLNSLTFSDTADYIVVVANSAGSVTSSVAKLTVLSTNLDVTAPGDLVNAFGDQSEGFWGADANPTNAIDNSFTRYVNGGSGFSASSGMAPFRGPVGLIVTPAMGNTLVSGLRVYTADAAPERDPADYTLEGSNDGQNFTFIASGALALPADRSNMALAVDPINSPMQEVLFANARGFLTYRLTFNNTRDSLNARSLQLGDIELLGVAAPASPNLSVKVGSTGALTLSTTAPGTLWSTTSLLNPTWVNEGPISGTVTITPSTTQPVKFYHVSVP